MFKKKKLHPRGTTEERTSEKMIRTKRDIRLHAKRRITLDLGQEESKKKV